MPTGRTQGTRILVKTKPGVSSSTLALGADRIRVQLEPLFTSIGRAQDQAAAPASAWHVLTAEATPGDSSPWDICHALIAHGLGIAGAPAPDFAEPDLQQRWPVADVGRQALRLTSTCDASAPEDPRFPVDPDPMWFHDGGHSQLAAAVEQLGGPQIAPRVRIAHLDTGYDPQHRTLPVRLRRDLGRNFVDDGEPADASDQSEGILNNLGHGTGTLSILAGAALPGGCAIGGAPFAEVVPIRVADRVVLFYNSAIARALDYVHALCRDPATRIDVVTMSMGGLASAAWADAVNALYDAGVFIVTAAGNNFGNLPTHNIVFPARFARVVAACGVMSDHAPYADLGIERMAGNYGPDSKMATALSGCTPNVPWAKFGCPDIVDHDGAGTSAATPQVAAAAALWIQLNRTAYDGYSEGWMRVEAVRKALFESAEFKDSERKWLGRGELRAHEALARAPADAASLRAEEPDSASFPFLRVLTGMGLAAQSGPAQRMLELEALQLSQSAAIEALLPDPSAPQQTLAPGNMMRIAEALEAHPAASQALRDFLHAALRHNGRPVPAPVVATNAVRQLHLQHALDPDVPDPTVRRLRIYAYDPSLGSNLNTLGLNEATVAVLWEKLAPGPVGEYLEVVDVDPASQCCYAPVDLNHASLLTQDGLQPSEANPQFHQQMAYAVAMKTIRHFEQALGRVALWAPHRVAGPRGAPRDRFVRRLRIYPHAIRAANAFYSPERNALLLGYFSASQTDSGDVLPGGYVFTAVSHDIVAHETTHALLDGLHRRFREPTNPDVLAFHEAFADIVALFQHFTMPEALRHQIARTRGDLGAHNLLAELAVQFGQATGLGYGGLRNAIAKPPTRADYQNATEAHDRGAVLVSAIFDAFLQIYRARTQDLIRLATGGTGVLPPGEIPVDLAVRMAREASKVAGQILNICIRALDYCPPVDITFGEYLRALITADRDLVPDDKRAYRVAFIAAFRDRGIYPSGVKNLSPGSLVWEPPPMPLRNVTSILGEMSLDWDMSVDRAAAFSASQDNAAKMHRWLVDPAQVSDDELAALGLCRSARALTIGGISGELGPIEVHSVRPARRIGPDGQSRSDLVVEVTQTFRSSANDGLRYRGGCTLLIDLESGEVRYFIRKKVDSEERLAVQQAFRLTMSDPLSDTYFRKRRDAAEPFAALHRFY
jgi:hypothetical protein